MKIIFILHHLPINIDPDTLPTEKEVPNLLSWDRINGEKISWVGYFFDHHVRLGQEFKNRFPEYEVECWRPYGYSLEETRSKEIDGITHRVFPATEKKIKWYGKVVSSPILINELELLESSIEKFLVHIQASHSVFGWKLINHFEDRKFPIIQEHGSSSLRIFHYLRSKSPLSKLKLWWFWIYWNQLKSIRNSDFYHSGSMYETNFLRRKGYDNVHYLKSGVEFSDEIVSSAERLSLRKELGLEEDKRIGISVRKFTSTYSADIFAGYVKRYLKHNSNASIILLGGTKKDEFYNLCVESGGIVVERVDQDLLVKYVRASDVNISQGFNRMFIDFAGIGTANIQALGFGIPLLSNQLQHIPATEEEMNFVGRPMKNYNEFEQNLDFMFNHPEHFRECSSIVKKYFEIGVTLDTLHERMTAASKNYY